MDSGEVNALAWRFTRVDVVILVRWMKNQATLKKKGSIVSDRCCRTDMAWEPVKSALDFQKWKSKRHPTVCSATEETHGATSLFLGSSEVRLVPLLPRFCN